MSKGKFGCIQNLQKFKPISIYLQSLNNLNFSFKKKGRGEGGSLALLTEERDHNLKICNVFLLGGDISQCLVLGQVLQIEY